MGAWIGSSQYPQIISHHLRLSPAIIGYLVICYPPRLADIWLRWYGQPMKTALFSPDNEVCSGRGHKFGPIFGTGSCMMCWMRSNIKSNTHDWFALMCYSMCFVSKYVKNQYRNIWLYDYIRTKNNHLQKCDESLRSVSVVLTILGNCIYWRPQHWRLVANSPINDLCNAWGRVQIIQFGKHLGAECSRSTSNQSKMANNLPAPECQKSFGQAGHLKIHMLTHSKERIYECVQCQRSWGGTWSPTVGRKYTTVKNAESPFPELV